MLPQAQIRKFRKQLANLPRAVALLRRAAALDGLLWAGTLLAQGLLPALLVLLTKSLVDALVLMIRTGPPVDVWRSPAAMVALAIGATMLASEGLRIITSWLRLRVSGALEDHVNDLIHRQSTTVDLSFYDTAEYHDHLHRARDEASYRPVALLENMGSLLQNGVTLVAMAAILLPYGWWLSVALLLSTLPALWVVLRHAMTEHDWRRRVSEDERRGHYLSWMMTGAHAAAEMRLFGLGDTFRAQFQALRRRLRDERLRLVALQGWADIFATGVGFAVAATCMAWMGWRALSGHATLGDLALFYQAFSQGQRLMRTLLSSVGQVYYNVLFLGNLFEFLDLKSTLTSPASPQVKADPTTPAQGNGLAVSFEEVVFDYPGTARRALDRLNLAIPAGQIAAVVGVNGAGKSTLIKLLCRFYDPVSGTIRVGGQDIRNLALEEVRQSVTVLFQEPVKYHASVVHNILPARRAGSPDEITQTVTEAVRAAGAEDIIAGLPAGMNSQLGRWFGDGIELSGGQWQRIALARAFARGAPVVVLDEPTSAMDSWAEAEWLRRFRAVMQGRTAIIVTHRFTTAMQADIIHVMDEGKIVESGTHGELLAANGRYAASWLAQHSV
jgi:ATP-binding cassette, subfamily B, bacterial